MHNSAVQESQLIQTVLVYALPVLFAITLHEAAHGYAARHFGDNTAWMMGRISELWQFYVLYGLFVGSMGHAAFTVLLPVIVTRGGPTEDFVTDDFARKIDAAEEKPTPPPKHRRHPDHREAHRKQP